jgi:diacylglycerol kinase family enzyme
MRESTAKGEDVALLCNPLAGGRWRVLANVLDSDEARHVRRIVTDDIDDIRDAIAQLGRRVGLLCIYGGDGTIYRVVNELLRGQASAPPLAFLGGGTMNVTAAWCGMSRSPGANFRRVMRAYRADRLLWREVPLLAVRQREHTHYGFTFGVGPLVRILDWYESGRKSRRRAVELGLRSVLGAVSGIRRAARPMLDELTAEITVDGERLPFDRFAALFANVTGVINPFVRPFTDERTRETFHLLAYAISVREFAMMAPLLARGLLPIDPRSLLHPISTWRQALLSVVGRYGLPSDPRYVNRPGHQLVVETEEPSYTIDGEVLPSLDRRFEVTLGPHLRVATLRMARGQRLLPRAPQR